MREPLAIEGSIDNNPLHRELLEIARMAGHHFMVDVALARDRRVAGVFAGHAENAHRSGVEFVSQAMLQLLDEPVDAVITTSAGYPLDLTFYQAIKGVTAASHIVKDGGRILLFAECSEGPGAPEFRQMLREHSSDRRFMDQIAAAPVVVDQWQLEKLALVTARAQVSFYTPGLPEEYRPSVWGQVCATVEEAIAGVFDGLPAGARVAVIPEGPYVLAKIGSRTLRAGRG